MQQCPAGRAADDADEAGADDVQHGVGLSAQGAHDEHLLRVGIERIGQGVRPLAAGERRERLVGRVDVGGRSELGQRRGDVVAVADHRVLVRSAERDVAAPGLAAGAVEVGAVGVEQPDRLRPAPAAGRRGRR